MLSAVWEPKGSSANNMSFLLSEVCLLEHNVQSPTGKTVCVWGFARPSTKLDMMLTWFWDYTAEPPSHRIWARGYKYLSPALFLSSSLRLRHSFITKIWRVSFDVRCLFFQKLHINLWWETALPLFSSKSLLVLDLWERNFQKSPPKIVCMEKRPLTQNNWKPTRCRLPFPCFRNIPSSTPAVRNC